jgi:hypothetical protein
MDDFKKNKMVWILAIVTLLNLGGYFVFRVAVEKVTDRVIEKLQKDYSPSPYGPGFDPDKVNPDAVRPVQRFFELRAEEKAVQAERPRPSGVWRQDFERDRGASHEQ